MYRYCLSVALLSPNYQTLGTQLIKKFLLDIQGIFSFKVVKYMGPILGHFEVSLSMQHAVITRISLGHDISCAHNLPPHGHQMVLTTISPGHQMMQ